MLFLNRFATGARSSSGATSNISVVGVFSGQSTNGSTIDVALSGTAAGDVVYGIQTNGDFAIIPPTDYTSVKTYDYFCASRKILTGADSSVVFPAHVNNNGNVAVVMVLRGAHNTTPEDVTVTGVDGYSAAPDSPSITVATNGALVLSGFAARGFPNVATPPTGYINPVTGVSDASANDVCAGFARKAVNAGAENPPAWATANTAVWYAVSIAVRPA